MIHPDCIAAIQAAAKAIGRDKLTKSQLDDIDTRLQRTMRQLARTEQDWQTFTPDQRLSMAAERAVQDIAAEAARKVRNVELQAVKTMATETRIKSLLAAFDNETRTHALARDQVDRKSVV